VLGSWTGPAPMLMCPGNHDVREEYAAGLRERPDQPRDEPIDEAFRVGGMLFCMLDSMVSARDGQRMDHGHLMPQTLTWLDDQLSAREPGERAVVCFHHPPVDVHIRLMDPIRLDNPEKLAAVLARHDDVVAVLVGHAHTACATTYAGLPLRVGGGVASTVVLDGERDGLGWPVISEDLGPSFAVHVVDDDGGIVTHWRTL
jgi:Icc protein